MYVCMYVVNDQFYSEINFYDKKILNSLMPCFFIYVHSQIHKYNEEKKKKFLSGNKKKNKQIEKSFFFFLSKPSTI